MENPRSKYHARWSPQFRVVWIHPCNPGSDTSNVYTDFEQVNITMAIWLGPWTAFIIKLMRVNQGCIAHLSPVDKLSDEAHIDWFGTDYIVWKNGIIGWYWAVCLWIFFLQNCVCSADEQYWYSSKRSSLISNESYIYKACNLHSYVFVSGCTCVQDGLDLAIFFVISPVWVVHFVQKIMQYKENFVFSNK